MARKPEDVLPQPPHRVTAHDVARLAGVSQSAVSRSFTAGASISVEVRQRVLQAAATLGYRPNLIARSLITRRSRTIGIAMGYLENQFYPTVLESLSVAFAARDYRLMLFTPVADSADPILDEILRHQLDAVLLASVSLSSQFAADCRRIGIPVVLLNRKTENDPVSTVTGDNFAGGLAIARMLAARGHRRCAFMAGLENSSTSRDREAGFAAGLAEAGLPPARREVGHYNATAARGAAQRLLGGRWRPDAIFCANDHMAMATIETARQERQLQPGRDISIVGFDDVALAAWPSFDLTTYSQPVSGIVAQVVSITCAHLEAADYHPVHAIVPGTLKMRGSVRGG